MMLEKFPWATFTLFCVTLIAAAVGGAVCIAGNMTFTDYLDTLAKFAFANGALAVGRGIAQASKK